MCAPAERTRAFPFSFRTPYLPLSRNFANSVVVSEHSGTKLPGTSILVAGERKPSMPCSVFWPSTRFFGQVFENFQKPGLVQIPFAGYWDCGMLCISVLISDCAQGGGNRALAGGNLLRCRLPFDACKSECFSLFSCWHVLSNWTTGNMPLELRPDSALPLPAFCWVPW